MLKKHSVITERILKYMNANGYVLSIKSKQSYALDSFVFEYQNAGGMKDNIKIEINYMIRFHILPVTKRKVNLPWLSEKLSVLSVAPMEIFASKIVALTADMFMTSVRKYTRARKLTPSMLNELIDKIEVHLSEKIDGKTVQQLTIHYNCIGNIEIPDLEKLPENNVSISTRQGVDVHYAYAAS